MASQSIKGGGKLYIRIFPHKSVTSIPAETRMGKGKGEVEYWAAIVKPGTVLFELAGVSEEARPGHLRPGRLQAPRPLPVRDPPADRLTGEPGPLLNGR